MYIYSTFRASQDNELWAAVVGAAMDIERFVFHVKQQKCPSNNHDKNLPV